MSSKVIALHLCCPGPESNRPALRRGILSLLRLEVGPQLHPAERLSAVKKACDCRLFCVPLQGGFVWELFGAAFFAAPN